MSTMARARCGAVVLLALALGACSPHGARAPRFILYQKGKFQGLYDHDGRLLRLLQDDNGDGRAELVVVMNETGKPERGEMDTDGDGTIDRLEHFAADGSLERVESVLPSAGSREAPSHPTDAAAPRESPHAQAGR